MNLIADVIDGMMGLNPFYTGLIGFLMGCGLLFWRFRGHHPGECKNIILSVRQKLSEKEGQVLGLQNINNQIQTQLAVSESLLEQSRKDRASLSQDVEIQQQMVGQLKLVNTELKTRIEEERKTIDEKIKLLQNAELQFSHHFESLASRILEEKSKKFSDQNNRDLDNLVNPLREQIKEFRKKVDDVYLNDSKDRTSLREEIKNLRLRTERISEDAINLTQALRGDKKVQGNWGELVLERILEQSGLRKGVEYHTQTGFRDGDNRLLKPDVIIHLPEGKDVVIDSKVSLEAYEAFCVALDERSRIQALNEHVRAIRNHIKDLSNKNYAALKGLRSLDFVLLFMPIEGAFLAAFQHDDKLFSAAFGHNIVVVTPTTLLATLRTIENIWRYERQNENAELIAERAGAMYDKIRVFVEDLEKLGTQIGVVQKTHDSVMNKLSRGQGNLIRQANRFVELGVKVKKQLPKSVAQLSEDGTQPVQTVSSDDMAK